MDDPLARLETDYCPPIDPALYSAIISDFDLNDAHSLQQARAILDALKDTAVAEEATGFDPSGSSSLADRSPETSNDSAASRETDLTSLSNALSSADFSDDQSATTTEDSEGIESLDGESKAHLLRDVFPALSHFTISHALKKNQDKWGQTLDDLLNQVYIHENSENQDGDKILAKGIDAFSEENIARRGRKGKKTKQLPFKLDERRSTSLPGTMDAAPPAINKWQAAGEDVAFIALHVNLPVKLVSSIYYRQNASIQGTITAILDSYLAKNRALMTEDPLIQVEAYELGQEFPTITGDNRLALIGITRQSTVAARELAKALTTETSNNVLSRRVIPQYAPLRISEEDDTPASYFAPDSASSSVGFAGASSRASSLEAARLAAMSQARAAYRKSKSNHLMGGAAAYYSQVSRDMGESSHLYNAAAADALVASQSSPSQIDLHGVTAEDAVRITRIKVIQWWESLGENRFNGRTGADDRAQGFRIVTGAGRHSKGGRGVLGPAVKKFLERDGWKIDATSGVIVVKGKVRAS